MNYNEAFDTLKKYGQEHVLDYYDELDDSDRKELLRQISMTDFEFAKAGHDNRKAEKRGIITPISVTTVDEINSSKEHYMAVGKDAIAKGKVGAVLLAGGMGTRLGSDKPKGVFDIGITRHVYIFERLIENLMDVVNETGSYIHLFVMTSEKNKHRYN